MSYQGLWYGEELTAAFILVRTALGALPTGPPEKKIETI